jgi:linearmycin/streptolysin S transport system permease protein
MKALWHVAMHDLRMHLADKSSIFFLALMPIGFVFFFSMISGDDSGPEDVKVTMPVVDRDGGFLATALIEQLRGEAFDTEVYSPSEADSVEFATRVVEIPAGFTDTVLAGGEAKVQLTRRATSNMSYDLAATVKLHQAQVRFLGNLARWAGAADSISEPSASTLPAVSLDPAEKGRFFALVAEPPRVTVQSEYAGRGRPVPSGMGQSIPGVLVMFVVMTVLIGGSEAITKEKHLGTLRRLATAPLTPRQILLGKTAGLTLLGMAQAVILLVLTEGLVRIGLIKMNFLWTPHLLGVIPLLVCYCICAAAIGVFLSGIFRTTQQAEGLAWLIGMMMSGIGGAWWPLEIMPSAMQLAGNFLPTAWAMKGLHGLITYGHGPSAVATPCAVLLLMAAVFWALGSRTLRFAD